MKKIVSFILLMGVLASIAVFPVRSANTLSSDVLFEMASLGYDVYAVAERGRLYGTHGKYFTQSTSPDARSLVCAAGSYCEKYLQKYIVRNASGGHYEIPYDLFEAVVFSVFTKSSSVLNTLRSSEYYKTDKSTPYYIPDFTGDMYGSVSSLYFYGYKSLGGGNYEAYAYINGSSNYTPASGDVEGRDYRITVGSTSTAYSNLECRVVKHKYIAINGVVKFVYNVGENVTVSAAEYMGKSVNPMKDTSVIKWLSSSYSVSGASVDFEKNVLAGANDYLDVINPNTGEDVDKIKQALGTKANNALEVFRVVITKNGQNVTSSTDRYSIRLPFGTSQYDVYQLKADGTVVQINAANNLLLNFQAGSYSALPYYSEAMTLSFTGPVTFAVVKTNRAANNATPPVPVVKVLVETTAPPVTQPPVTEPHVTEVVEETTEPVSDVVAEEETTEPAEDTTKEEVDTDPQETSEKAKEKNKKDGGAKGKSKFKPVWVIVPAAIVAIGGAAAAAAILIIKKKKAK